MSGDPEQEYFADGIVEDIITALSRFKSLFVIARNSSFTYKGQAVDIKQVARKLGVGRGRPSLARMVFLGDDDGARELTLTIAGREAEPLQRQSVDQVVRPP